MDKRVFHVPRESCILGPLMHSTTTVSSSIGFPPGQSFSEEHIFPSLEPTEVVHEIKCDYGHVLWAPEVAVPAPPKKRAGRKPIVRVPKPRKHPGNGTSFHSQITFHVLGEYCRPTEPGDDCRNHCLLLPDARTRIRKSYKIKLFRNGNITIPGSLTEDMRDVHGPLQSLCDFLTAQGVFEHPDDPSWLLSFSLPQSQMFNYKFRLLEGSIDLYRFSDYCRTLYQGLVHVSPEDLRRFLLCPTFHDSPASPSASGWRDYFSTKHIRCDSGPLVELDVPSPEYILQNLVTTKTPKNIICRREHLLELLACIPLQEHYQRLCQLYYMARGLSNRALERILYCWLYPALRDTVLALRKKDTNFLVGVRYEQETYAAMLIRFRSLSSPKPEKCITVKIFPSQPSDFQKINIDGAVDREEAEMVYWWLNFHLRQSGALYQHDYYSDDDEFSYTSSEGEDPSDCDSDSDSDGDVDSAERDAKWR